MTDTKLIEEMRQDLAWIDFEMRSLSDKYSRMIYPNNIQVRIDGFTNTAISLNKAIVTLQGQWVPVSERLPEPHTDVLTAVKGVSIPIQTRIEGTVWRDGQVTHWMPLPPLPEPTK